MTRRRRASCLCIAALTLAGGCADPPVAPDAYLAPDAYVAPDAGPDRAEQLAIFDRMFDAQCAAAVRCSRPDTQGDAYAISMCSPVRRARIEAAIEAGYSTVDPALAQRCIDGVTTMRCVLPETDPPYVHLGSLPSQYWSLDYLLSYCSYAVVQGVRSCGVPAVVCGPLEVCTNGPLCTDVCVAAAPEGGACASQFCAAGLDCVSGTCVRSWQRDPPRCSPDACRVAGLGHDCSVGGDCIDAPGLGAACVPLQGGAQCASELECHAVCALPSRIGDPCRPTRGCSGHTQCDPVSSTCQPPTYCDEITLCPTSMYCSPTTHRCGVDPDGSLCDTNLTGVELGWPIEIWLDTCPEGYMCSAEDDRGRCARTAALAESCGTTGPLCVEGTTCSAGVCVPFENPWLAVPDPGLCW